MQQILVKSVHDAFEYVMAHYYPFGMEEFAGLTDSYAVISIQDSHTGGFGVEFARNRFCCGVLTVLADDIVRPVEGARALSPEDAGAIIDFITEKRDADTLLVHCYAGQSRSLAVAEFAVELLGDSALRHFGCGSPNPAFLKTLRSVHAARLKHYGRPDLGRLLEAYSAATLANLTGKPDMQALRQAAIPFGLAGENTPDAKVYRSVMEYVRELSTK